MPAAIESTFTRPHLYPKQEQAIFTPKRWSCIEASTKSGKAQPLSAIVWTPNGPKSMGNVHAGDFVIGVDGLPTRVLEVFPQGIRQMYRVTFSDGTAVECDGEHLWEVEDSRHKVSVVTTLDLKSWPEWQLHRSHPPKIEPVQFTRREVPLDPYLIGVLIGDGGLSTDIVRFSSADIEIVDAVRATIPPDHDVKHLKGCDYSITAGSMAARLREDGTHIATTLRNLGLMGKKSHEKKVPLPYIYNDIETRVALLQGLMDTDGTVNSKGQPIIEQTSWELAKDIEEIVQSLGGSVLTHEDNSAGYFRDDDTYVSGRRRYRQAIKLDLDIELFRLERKLRKVVPSQKSGGRMFRTIVPSRQAEAKCIRVEDPRHLYLTDGFIPTHNTVGCIAWMLEQALSGGPNHNYWWVAPGYPQALIAYNRIRNGLTRGSFVSHDTPIPRLDLLNGSIISFRSGDNPDSLYGEDVYAAVVDEASRVKAESWFALRSTLTATGGPARLIGNVKGRKNWFYEMCRRIERGQEPNGAYARITVQDAIEAGVIPQSEVDDARRNLPEHIFRELYEAIPADDGGNPFGEDHIYACVNDLSNQPCVAYGVDLAKKQDFLVVIGLDDGGRVAHFSRWQGWPWRKSIARIWDIIGEDTPALVDSTGIGDPVLEELQAEGHGNFRGYNFSAISKQRLMEGLAVSIQSHEVSFPDGPIKEELLGYEYQLTRTGFRYGPSETSPHDDCVCALALAREQWSTSAPATNLMAFYAEQGRKAKQAAQQAEDEAPLPLAPHPILSRAEVLDNELTELYRSTIAQYEPDARVCKRCGEEVKGAERVTDGQHVWHTACALVRTLTLSPGDESLRYN